MRKLEMTERQRLVGLKMDSGCRQYSAKMAEKDLNKFTGGYYYLYGYTGQYAVICKANKKAIITQKTSKLNLRDMVLVAIEFFETATPTEDEKAFCG